MFVYAFGKDAIEDLEKQNGLQEVYLGRKDRKQQTQIKIGF